MIQGYAIYLRTHRDTGKQYAGAVWWSDPKRSPEKACFMRWRREDHDGIRGLFGDFDSTIILSEKRSAVPDWCSERTYHIRIAVDEDKAILAIPAEKRLNLISPLMQLHAGFRNEERTRLAGKMGFLAQSSAVRIASGLRTRANKKGIFAPGYDFGIGGRAGGPIGGRSKSSAKLAASRRNILAIPREVRQVNGCKARDMETGIFSPDFDKSSGGRIGGRKNVESGHLARVSQLPQTRAAAHRNGVKAGRNAVASGHIFRIRTKASEAKGGYTATHIRWHVKRNIRNSKCSLCVETQNAGPSSTST